MQLRVVLTDNLALEKVICDADVGAGTILSQSSQLLTYTHDIAIMGRSTWYEQSTYLQIEHSSSYCLENWILSKKLHLEEKNPSRNVRSPAYGWTIP